MNYVIPLGPPSLITRGDPDADIVVGHNDDRVIVSLSIPRARRLAALLGLFSTSPHKPVDRGVLDVAQAERDEWIRTLIDLLASAAYAGSPIGRRRLKILPVRWGPTPSELGHRETGEPRPSPGLSHTPPAPHWSQSVADAGELDDTVLDGFLCSCGWIALNKGPDLTPTYDGDVAAHVDTCEASDDPDDLYLTAVGNAIDHETPPAGAHLAEVVDLPVQGVSW